MKEKLKIDEWSIRRRIESLRQMDQMLSDLNVGSRYTIWRKWGGGLQNTPEKTYAKWEYIASDNVRYINAIFCYMVCTLEKYTLKGFSNIHEHCNDNE